MKRPHRRLHLLVWLILAPATLAIASIAWTNRPISSAGTLPAPLQGATDAGGQG